MSRRTVLSTCALGAIADAWSGVHAQTSAYNPLTMPETAGTPNPLDLVARDARRSRDISLRVYLPNANSPASVVLFSHGLGGSRESNPYLGKHGSARGYVVVCMQHAGSDEAVWKGLPALARLGALKKAAANPTNALNRFKDVATVLDQLQAWSALACPATRSAPSQPRW